MKSAKTSASEVTKLIRDLPPEAGAIARAVRRVILKALPGAVEAADPKARIIGYSYGPGYRGLIATIILSQRGVKLGIVRGAELPDPTGVLEGGGKVHRHIAFKRLRDVDRPAVPALLRAALAAWKHRGAVGA
jgi:hypothetical protein